MARGGDDVGGGVGTRGSPIAATVVPMGGQPLSDPLSRGRLESPYGARAHRIARFGLLEAESTESDPRRSRLTAMGYPTRPAVPPESGL